MKAHERKQIVDIIEIIDLALRAINLIDTEAVQEPFISLRTLVTIKKQCVPLRSIRNELEELL